MFGIGMPELVVIMVVALIVLCPKRLPEAAKGLGRALREFRHATSSLTEELNDAQIMLAEETREAQRAMQHAGNPHVCYIGPFAENDIADIILCQARPHLAGRGSDGDIIAARKRHPGRLNGFDDFLVASAST